MKRNILSLQTHFVIFVLSNAIYNKKGIHTVSYNPTYVTNAAFFNKIKNGWHYWNNTWHEYEMRRRIPIDFHFNVYLRLDASLEMVDIIEAEKALLLLASSHFGFPLTILPLRRSTQDLSFIPLRPTIVLAKCLKYHASTFFRQERLFSAPGRGSIFSTIKHLFHIQRITFPS